uniref:RING-type domain-containing protein n=2 Tax=Attheya septentrionalis TaxID=420275 RepID=A0A7S2UPE1_9STRA|mmetsp:Transcript_5000/g.8785  ORF Transcript_5000/g.8785 Transcript_5000/m.8785 type:complete len:181 (+) Transcript_5000:110-652(+)
MILNCPECGVDSCRKCGDEPHIPLKCSEVEKKTETNGRKVVEEAMTAAKVRICPKCKKGFFKSDGCNKITCACGTFICYVCRQPIPPKVGYAHFCQTAHCQHQSCHKCPLYSNAEEDDKRAMREAGMKAVAQVQSNNVASTRSSSSSSTSAPIQVRVDVDALLQVPSPRRAVPFGMARRH